MQKLQQQQQQQAAAACVASSAVQLVTAASLVPSLTSSSTVLVSSAPHLILHRAGKLYPSAELFCCLNNINKDVKQFINFVWSKKKTNFFVLKKNEDLFICDFQTPMSLGHKTGGGVSVAAVSLTRGLGPGTSIVVNTPLTTATISALSKKLSSLPQNVTVTSGVVSLVSRPRVSRTPPYPLSLILSQSFSRSFIFCKLYP